MRLLVFALALFASPALAQNADFLIGRPVLQLPGGWGSVGGTLLDPPGAEPSHTLSMYEQVGTGNVLFTYARTEEMVDDRYPLSRILAVLLLDDIRDGEIATWSACVDTNQRPAVVIAGEYQILEDEGVSRLGPVRLAWRLDRDAEQFVSVASTAVTCPDETLP
ncbi:MAG: hypothetical protein AAGI52_05620 [Bacteroidota bacterium]